MLFGRVTCLAGLRGPKRCEDIAHPAKIWICSLVKSMLGPTEHKRPVDCTISDQQMSVVVRLLTAADFVVRNGNILKT